MANLFYNMNESKSCKCTANSVQIKKKFKPERKEMKDFL